MEAGTVDECGGGEGEGDGEVVLDVWEWGADVYWEAFCCAGYVQSHLPYFSFFSFCFWVTLGAEAMLICMRIIRDEIDNSGHLYEFHDTYC